MSLLAVYAVFASEEEAERVARTVVTERLAACANILGPCRSIYFWEGAVQEGPEVAALFKTVPARGDALIARIRDLHSYALPAVTAWPVPAASAGYAEWVEACCAAPSSFSSASS